MTTLVRKIFLEEKLYGYTPASKISLANFIQDLKDFSQAVRRGDKLFVQFTGDHGVHGRRKGAIAEIVGFISMGMPRSDGHMVFELILAWDDRKNSVKACNYSGLAWLKDYTGPTVWKFAKPDDKRADVPVVKDRLGTKIEVDDFVSFAFNTSGTLDLMFGKVTRITSKGDVYVLNQELGTETPQAGSWYGSSGTKPAIKERHIRTPETALMVMTRDIVDRITLLKLSRA